MVGVQITTGCSISLCQDAAQVAELVVTYTKALGEQPFKSVEDSLAATRDYSEMVISKLFCLHSTERTTSSHFSPTFKELQRRFWYLDSQNSTVLQPLPLLLLLFLPLLQALAESEEKLPVIWEHQLMQFPAVSSQVAAAIAAAYPSPSHLMKVSDETPATEQCLLSVLLSGL